MKKFYLLFISICISQIASAQIINFPDANFKLKLLQASADNTIATPIFGDNVAIDVNGNGEIELSEAVAIYQLDVSDSNISNLEGIQFFINLRRITCSENQLTDLTVLNSMLSLEDVLCAHNMLTQLDLTSLTNLETLNCYDNNIVTLNLSGLPNLFEVMASENVLTALNLSGCTSLFRLYIRDNLLTSLDVTEFGETLFELQCYNNPLGSLDLTGMAHLTYLHCDNNQLTTLDVSDLTNLISLSCTQNNLSSLNLKNGRISSVTLIDNPNLNYICADDDELDYIENVLTMEGIQNCAVSSYCSFSPGGTYFTIAGEERLDNDGNGCNSSDPSLGFLKFAVSSSTQTGYTISDDAGSYSVMVPEGTYTVVPQIDHPEYFSVSPAILNVSFPASSSPLMQNFCLSPIGNHPDLKIIILPIVPARPGFNAKYKIVYSNEGNTMQSGSVALQFDDPVLDYIISTPTFDSQTGDVIAWNYSDLMPFESRFIEVTLNVNSPMETPAVNIGDQLSFTSTIYPVSGDDHVENNVATLKQDVVGAFDPNDKTCVEGNTVGPEMIGEYVHYLIRFENTGTYPAENIVVKDMIDTIKFDVSTLVPISGSHSFETRVSSTNKVEFIFENIMLPFDDANNDGYVAFKIKTKPTLVVGNTFSNNASIYFDYNFPIVTNTATTTIQQLGVNDFEFSDHFTLYPNPAKDVLNIAVNSDTAIKSIDIYNVLGQLVLTFTNVDGVSDFDVSNLETGNYFLKIKSDRGMSTTKFVKQ